MSRKRAGRHSHPKDQAERRGAYAHVEASRAESTSGEATLLDDTTDSNDVSYSTAGRCLVIGLFAWVFLLGITPLRDTDIWWHLKTGEYIWNEGTIPQTDLYTYTDWNQPWIDLHWGFQLLMLGLYRLGGVHAIVLSKAVALTAAVVIGWFATGRALSPVVRMLCWLPPIVCMSGRALERPEMLSLIFLAYWLWVMPRLNTRPRLIWTLPPVMLIWVNCHGLFVLGLVVGAAYVVDYFAHAIWPDRWGLGPDTSQPRFIHLFRAGVLTLAACFVNPYVEEGAFFPATLYRKFSVDQDIYGDSVAEFRSPLTFYRSAGLSNLYLDAEILVFVVTALSFLWLLSYRRWHPYRVILFAAFSHLAWEASRNTNIFSLVSGVLLVANLEDVFKLRSAASRSVPTRAKDATLPWLASLRAEQVALGFVALLIVSIFTGHWAAFGKEGKRLGWDEERAWFIHDAARFAGQPGMPQTAFVSNFGQAAVYLYHNGPERRVFIDGRLEVARKETYILNEQINIAMIERNLNWENAVKDLQGNLPVVILDSRYSREQITGMLNTPGWRLVFADRSAAVFLDNGTADRLNLPLADYTPLRYPPSITDPR